MYIDEDTKQQILARATLEAALDKFCTRAQGYTQRKRVYTCPFCGKEIAPSPCSWRPRRLTTPPPSSGWPTPSA